MKHQFTSIRGLEGRTPFDCVLTVGIKNERAIPVRTDRFFLLHSGYEPADPKKKGGGWRNQRHPMHPSFRQFNSLKDDDDSVKVLHGNLMLPDRDSSMNVQLAAQQLGKGQGVPPGGGVWTTPPGGRPACTGDGLRASRYAGQVDGDPHYIDIDCPNELCFFRLKKPKICGALGRVYFRVRWPEGNGLSGLPSILVRYQTHGWDSASNLKGMFDHVEEVAAGLGMDPDAWCFTGLPFSMSVGTKTKPDKKVIDHRGRETTGVRFPEVRFACGDVTTFLEWQVGLRQTLLAAPRSVALIGDGLDDEEASREGIGEVLATLTPGIPTEVSEAVDGMNTDADMPSDGQPERPTWSAAERKKALAELAALAKKCALTSAEVFKHYDWDVLTETQWAALNPQEMQTIADGVREVGIAKGGCETCGAVCSAAYCSVDCEPKEKP